MICKLSISRWLAAGVTSLYFITPAFAEGSALHSGKYEQLMLAVTPEHQIEGFYAESRGEGTTFSCAFYLQGKVDTGKRAALATWFHDVYPGSVTSSADGVILKIEQGKQHPGCMNVLMPDIATGMELTQTASKQWISLVTVVADKAWLQKSADLNATQGPYVVKGDVVGVLAFTKGGAQVEFINANGRSFIGWINQGQYARLIAPRS